MPFANFGDAELFFDVYGSKLKILDNSVEDKHTLIVLHGGPGFVDHTLYVSFWSIFSDVAQVIFIDQRGSGRSHQRQQSYSNLAQQGKDVYLFCEHLGIKKPIVAGVSWGGVVAMSYATQFPEHPQGLILCNTEAKISPEARREAFYQIGGKRAADTVWEFDTNWNETVQANYINYCMPLYAKNAYTSAELSRCIKNLPYYRQLIKNEYLTFDLRNELKVITAPFLYLAGSHDPVHPKSCAIESFECLPKGLGKLIILENATDPVYRDQPKSAEKAIREFLKTIPVP